MCLTCSRANVACVLTSLRANVSCVLTCSRANVSCALTCSRANVAWVLTVHVPTCLACLCAHVTTCLVCLPHTNKPCVLTSSRAITTSSKYKFSILFLPYIFVIVLCLFPVKKNCCTFLDFFYQAEVFNGCYDKLCTIKSFGFCWSITLRVIFKWLIKDGRWIIMCGS